MRFSLILNVLTNLTDFILSYVNFSQFCYDLKLIVCTFRQTHVAFLDEGDLIKIDGPPEEADKIRDALEKQAEDLKANMEYVEITVDAKYHKHIIGKGGSTVNRLKQVSSLLMLS